MSSLPWAWRISSLITPRNLFFDKANTRDVFSPRRFLDYFSTRSSRSYSPVRYVSNCLDSSISVLSSWVRCVVDVNNSLWTSIKWRRTTEQTDRSNIGALCVSVWSTMNEWRNNDQLGLSICIEVNVNEKIYRWCKRKTHEDNRGSMGYPPKMHTRYCSVLFCSVLFWPSRNIWYVRHSSFPLA